MEKLSDFRNPRTLCQHEMMNQSSNSKWCDCIDSDATFSDIRSSYRTFSQDLERKSPCTEQESNAFIRLIVEFLKDPDIRAKWSVKSDRQNDAPESVKRNN
jgi:hypothetical protein